MRLPAYLRLFSLAGVAGLLSSCLVLGPQANTDSGIHKIKHVIVIMQENRTFDSYFGTFPGVNGLPKNICIPDPASGGCAKPYHDPNDLNGGGPHGQVDAIADINLGKMDGFVAQALNGKKGCSQTNNPACGGDQTDVMGFHDAREIPNYWYYAQQYVLQDRMFEPNASWSLPEHLFMVSEWSAHCTISGDPKSCVNALQSPGTPPDFKKHAGKPAQTPDYAWTEPSPTARTTRWPVPPPCSGRRHRASGTHCRTSTPSRRTASCRT